jgi:hypothetical protein
MVLLSASTIALLLGVAVIPWRTLERSRNTGFVVTVVAGVLRPQPAGGRPGRARSSHCGARGGARTCTLRFFLLEGFKVVAPFWIIENLVIEGTCHSDGDCEHAFHVSAMPRPRSSATTGS